MKAISLYILLLLSFLLQITPLSACAPDNQQEQAAELILLRAGTVVSFTLNEEIDAETAEVGHTVDFFVRSNVTVNGKVVIAAGSIAEGWVRKISPSCNGYCYRLTITVENVQTVDGQRIYVRSIPYTVQIDCCGREESAIINIGTNLSARVLNDVSIEA